MMPGLIIDDVPYQVMVEDLEMSTHGFDDTIAFTARHQFKVVNKCDCCGRFDMEPQILFTVDQLVANGWIVPVKKET